MTIPRYALPSTESIAQTQLANGITILVYENPAVESVVLYGSLCAGSVYEPIELNGLASMTASALMRGTTSRDFETLHSELEDIGAELDFNAAKYRVSFNGRALAEDFETLVEVCVDAIRNPIFDADEIAEERTKRITELNYAHQDTRYMASHTFRKSLYPRNHPFHYSSYGSLNTLPNLSSDDLRSFHQAQYGPEGMLIVVVGAIPADIATAIIAEALSDWENPNQADKPQLPQILLPSKTQFVETQLAGKTQADIVMGLVGPSRYAEDFLPAQIANSILGEFGMMGRVGHVIREQLGLAYYAYSRLDGGEGPGAWTVSVGVAPENITLAVEKAQEEIEKLTTELVSQDDLEDNQAYFTGRLPLRLESNYGLASTIHSIAQYGLGLDYLVEYHAHVYDITRADVLHAAQSYLQADKLVISVAH